MELKETEREVKYFAQNISKTCTLCDLGLIHHTACSMRSVDHRHIQVTLKRRKGAVILAPNSKVTKEIKQGHVTVMKLTRFRADGRRDSGINTRLSLKLFSRSIAAKARARKVENA